MFYTDMVDGVSEEIIEGSSFREEDSKEGAKQGSWNGRGEVGEIPKRTCLIPM